MSKLFYKTGSLVGLGNRQHIVTKTLLSSESEMSGDIKQKLVTDGASVPKVFILMFLCSIFIADHFFIKLNDFLILVVIYIGFLSLVVQNNGVFQKPAFLHDYRFQNSTGFFSANFLFLCDMFTKVKQTWQQRTNRFIAILKLLFYLK